MSEEPKEEGAKKKGSKLPIIMALVLMLGGGGFFMMKKGGKAEKPAVKLGKEEILLPDEFIVNMLDGRTYVRAKIGLRAKDGFKAEEAISHNAEICDVINSILKTTKPDEVVTEVQVKKLKFRIATALNKIFKEDEPKEADKSDKKKDKKKSSDESSNKDESSSDTKNKDNKVDEGADKEIPEGWDSAEGPILKVFFKALATQ
jgi:flagellar basal body-associated protein FliL